MNNTLLKALLFLLSFILSALYNPATHADTLVGEIEFINCKVSDVTGKYKVKAECATLSVPENYAEADGTKIDLQVSKPGSASRENPKGDLVSFADLSVSGRVVNAYNALKMAERIVKRKK